MLALLHLAVSVKLTVLSTSNTLPLFVVRLVTATRGLAVATEFAGVAAVTDSMESALSVGFISHEVRFGVTRFGGVALSSMDPLKPAMNFVSSSVMTRSVPTTVGPEVMSPAKPEVAL